MVKLSMLDLIPHPDPYYSSMFEWNSQLLTISTTKLKSAEMN